MRILDRYVVRQWMPAWCWGIAIFLLLSCLLDLFGHLDEIFRYRIAALTLIQYYVNFSPLVFVHAAPFASLLATAFVTSRLTRNHELLALSASGTSLLRSSLPFLFMGWCVGLCVFAVNERVIPHTSRIQEHIQREAFREQNKENVIENVAIIDSANRLYHARKLHVKTQELHELTVLEHDSANRPTSILHASRAIWTKDGWLLLYGTFYREGTSEISKENPQPFMERLIPYPVNLQSFSEPQTRTETMRYGQLRLFIIHLKQMGITTLRRYYVELVAKVTVPFMNVVICLIAFVGTSSKNLRGNLKGLGVSLGWGTLYFIGVHVAIAMAKAWDVPIFITAILPHVIALWKCFRILRRAT